MRKNTLNIGYNRFGSSTTNREFSAHLGAVLVEEVEEAGRSAEVICCRSAARDVLTSNS